MLKLRMKISGDGKNLSVDLFQVRVGQGTRILIRKDTLFNPSYFLSVIKLQRMLFLSEIWN